MMWILPIVGILGVVSGFGFLTLAIASGLYYISELVEEHTVLAKRVLRQLIYAVIAIQTLLWLVDGFPWKLSLLSIFSHVIYMQNLRHFPVVKLTDVVFILSCVLVFLNHYAWFTHFQAPPPTHLRSSSNYLADHSQYNYDPSSYPSFTEVTSYFGLCVWLVPCALFVGLSAGENVLPSMGSEYATGEGSSFVSAGRDPKKGGREGMAKALVNGLREWVSETGRSFGLWKGDGDDGKRW